MKMTRRRIAAPIKPSTEEPLDSNTVMPDPEAEDRAQNPAKYRKGLPEGKIELKCATCQTVGAIHVDNPEDYSEQDRKRMFTERRWKYNPPTCHMCLRSQAIPKES